MTIDNTIRRILAGIACEVGQIDGTIATMQEARDGTLRPEVSEEIHFWRRRRRRCDVTTSAVSPVFVQNRVELAAHYACRIVIFDDAAD